MAARVLLDARKIGDGGIGVYLDSLVTGAYELSQAGMVQLEYVLLVPPLSEIANHPIKSAMFQRWAACWECCVEPAGKYSASEYWLLAGRQARTLRKVDLYHSPHYTLPFFLGVPTVVTIHDLIHLRPESPRLKRLIADRLIRSALRRAGRVITVSEHSRLMLEQRFENGNPPTKVIPNALPDGFGLRGADQVEEVQIRLGVERPYCLFVGSDKPHKGLLAAIRALERIGVSAVGDDLELVVVGEGYSAAIREQVAVSKLPVRFVGAIATEDLVALYNGAEATLITSLEEGFGLCALEALACGSPVVSTPLPSVYEICGDRAIYSKDFGAESIAKALQHVLTKPRSRTSSLESDFRYAQSFTVAAKVLATCAVYDEAIRAGGGTAQTVSAAEQSPSVWQSQRIQGSS